MSVGERAFGKYVGGEMAGGWHALPALMQGLFGVHRGDMGVAAGRADPTSHHDKKSKTLGCGVDDGCTWKSESSTHSMSQALSIY